MPSQCACSKPYDVPYAMTVVKVFILKESNANGKYRPNPIVFEKVVLQPYLRFGHKKAYIVFTMHKPETIFSN